MTRSRRNAGLVVNARILAVKGPGLSTARHRNLDDLFDQPGYSAEVTRQEYIQA